MTTTRLDLSRSHDGWSTILFHPFDDEESCWWGFWCCWLVSARNTKAFELGSSFAQTCVVVVYVFFALSLAIFDFGLTILALVVGSLVYSCYRAHIRKKMREKLGIPGTLASDFLVHCFFPLCAVCQESREEKHRGFPMIDYCGGQALQSLETMATFTSSEQLNNSISNMDSSRNSNDIFIGNDNAEQQSFGSSLSLISKTSKVICGIFGALLFFVSGLMVLSNSSASISVLLLTCLQPGLIFYFFYWRKRRHYVLLDNVIKIFAAGFFVATFQSLIFESILQFIMQLAVLIILSIEYGDEFNAEAASGGESNNSNSTHVTGNAAATTTGGAGIFHAMGGTTYSSASLLPQPMLLSKTNVSSRVFSRAGNLVSTLVEETTRLIASSGSSSSSSSFNSYSGNSTSTGYGDDSEDGSITDMLTTQQMKDNWWLGLLAVLFMAFVVAAGTEETMKHFTLRYYRFPRPLVNPHAVQIYLMAGALGFATAENFEYVFQVGKIAEEFLVLVMRALMPIHIICSVLQASTLSKVLAGQSTMHLFNILLPAVTLHGSFDCFLFMMGGIALVYELDMWWVALLQITIPVGMTVAGIIVARNQFKHVCDTYEGGWQRFSGTEGGGERDGEEERGVVMNPIGVGRSLQTVGFNPGEGEEDGSFTPTIVSPPGGTTASAAYTTTGTV